MPEAGVYQVTSHVRIIQREGETQDDFALRSAQLWSNIQEAAAKLDGDLEDYEIEWLGESAGEPLPDFEMAEAVLEGRTGEEWLSEFNPDAVDDDHRHRASWIDLVRKERAEAGPDVECCDRCGEPFGEFDARCHKSCV